MFCLLNGKKIHSSQCQCLVTNEQPAHKRAQFGTVTTYDEHLAVQPCRYTFIYWYAQW